MPEPAKPARAIANSRAPKPPEPPKPLLETDVIVINALYYTVLALLEACRRDDEMPLNPTHIGAIRDLIAYAPRVANAPHPGGGHLDRPYDALVPLLDLGNRDASGHPNFSFTGGAASPRDEALAMLGAIRELLSIRANCVMSFAAIDYQHAFAPVKPIYGETAAAPASLTSLDLRVTRLLPRVEALIAEIRDQADAPSVSDGEQHPADDAEDAAKANAQVRPAESAPQRASTGSAPAPSSQVPAPRAASRADHAPSAAASSPAAATRPPDAGAAA